MIKGSQRQMIVVRTDDSRYFDEAYFVLRRNLKTPTQNDMLKEANRILSERVSPPRLASRASLWRWLFFGVGVLCGALVTVAFCLMLL